MVISRVISVFFFPFSPTAYPPLCSALSRRVGSLGASEGGLEGGSSTARGSLGAFSAQRHPSIYIREFIKIRQVAGDRTSPRDSYCMVREEKAHCPLQSTIPKLAVGVGPI